MKDIFLALRKQLEAEAKKVKKRVLRPKKENPDFKNYILEKIKKEIQQSLFKVFQKEISTNELELQIPPAYVGGDIALPIFDLAKKLKITPKFFGEKLVKELNKRPSLLIKKASRVNGFVNIELDKKNIYQKVLEQVSKLAQNYGKNNLFENQLAIIEYSSPNIAKPMGVGHLRSTIIGQTLANIYEAVGFRVIKENYLGDWGAQFGKLLYAYHKWGHPDKVFQNPIYELKKLYIKFHEKEKHHPEITKEAAKLAKKLEAGDKRIIDLWQKFRKLSLKDFKKTYKLLDIKFDIFSGESYFVKEAKNIIRECIRKGLGKKAKDSELVVVEGLADMPPFLLQKADGTSLYLTRDLALLKFRVKVFRPNTILYVVGQEQELHFRQLFFLARKLGYLPKGLGVKHIKLGLVLAPEGKKMATRKGTAIELKELLKKALEKSEQILQEKNPKLSPKERNKIARIVGIGAIIYNDLKQNREHNITFDWDKMLNFEMGSAPYLQYTAVRIQSILRKIKKELKTIKSLARHNLIFEKDIEFDLSRKLMFFPQVILTCQKTDQAHHLCTYLEELAQLFNTFYTKISILKTKHKILQASRVILIQNVLEVLKNGLSLLNIKIPQKM